jgi:uncharacterized protein (UPF0332 family)
LLVPRFQTILQSFLGQKSDINLKAAHLLHDNECYAAVPHCAYYACLQRMKYILCKEFNVYCEDDSKDLRDKGSHQAIIKEFKLKIKTYNKVNSHQVRILLDNFYKLKTYRENSDYNHTYDCTKEKSNNTIDLVNELMDIVKLITNHGQHSS